MNDVLIISAREIAEDGIDRVARRLLELIAGFAGTGSIVLRIDFPGEPEGGFHAAVRRLRLLGQIVWWLSWPLRWVL